jgi:alpha-L-arabinofuranosidase
VTLTVTNSSLSETRETEVVVRGASVNAVRTTTLVAHSATDVNTFVRPDAIKPVTADVAARDAGGVYRFPPASVTKLAMTLDG